MTQQQGTSYFLSQTNIRFPVISYPPMYQKRGLAVKLSECFLIAFSLCVETRPPMYDYHICTLQTLSIISHSHFHYRNLTANKLILALFWLNCLTEVIFRPTRPLFRPKCDLQPANVIHRIEAIHLKNVYIDNVFHLRFMQILKILSYERFVRGLVFKQRQRQLGNRPFTYVVVFFTRTSPSPTSDDGDYELAMFKNGVRVTKYCGWRGKCTFKVR